MSMLAWLLCQSYNGCFCFVMSHKAHKAAMCQLSNDYLVIAFVDITNSFFLGVIGKVVINFFSKRNERQRCPIGCAKNLYAQILRILQK